jgi:uncharacterized membrane protein
MIAIGIVNHKRPFKWVDSIIKSCVKQTLFEEQDFNLIISTDNPEEYKDIKFDRDIKIEIIDNTELSIAQSKNSIIEKAVELKSTKLFIIEDDIVVDETYNQTFEEYYNLLTDMNLGLVFNCYTKNSNNVINFPSPRLLIGFKGHANCEMLTTNRHEVGDFSLIDLEKNKERFNEDLKIFDFSEYVFKSWKKGHLPFLNQFFDVPDSWDKIYANTECETSLRVYKDEEVAKDKEIMDRVVNNEWKVNNELDDVIKYIREQLGV